MWFRNAMVPQRKTCGNGHLTFFRGFLHHPGLMKRVTFLAPLLMGDPQVQLELRNVPPPAGVRVAQARLNPRAGSRQEGNLNSSWRCCMGYKSGRHFLQRRIQPRVDHRSDAGGP